MTDLKFYGIDAIHLKERDELLPGDGAGEVEAVQHVPGERRLDGDQAGERAGFDQLRAQAKFAQIHDVSARGEGVAIKAVAADHHIIGINLLRDFINGCAGWLGGSRNAETIERVDAIITADEKQ